MQRAVGHLSQLNGGPGDLQLARPASLNEPVDVPVRLTPALASWRDGVHWQSCADDYAYDRLCCPRRFSKLTADGVDLFLRSALDRPHRQIDSNGTAFGNAFGESLASTSQPKTQGVGPWSEKDFVNGADLESDQATDRREALEAQYMQQSDAISLRKAGDALAVTRDHGGRGVRPQI